MNAEERIRATVRDLLGEGRRPTPKAILARLGRLQAHAPRSVGGDRLNGQESRWRADELRNLGFIKTPAGRWAPRFDAPQAG